MSNTALDKKNLTKALELGIIDWFQYLELYRKLQ